MNFGDTVFGVTIDNLRSHIISLVIIVYFSYHNLVSKYITKRNKT